mgnify:FL=1
MRNLAAGNKMNFTIFTFIVIIILLILAGAVVIVLQNGKTEYEVSSSICVYDSDYNYIELENIGTVSKKWTGGYYLKESQTDKEYNLGSYSVAFDKNRNSLTLFGDFYQVFEGGNVNKLTNYNTINGTNDCKFYKIADRKYLIVAPNIENNTGSLSTKNYLIVIVDRLGNAQLLNNQIDAKSINEMVISTSDFDFDVANEQLTFKQEEASINLKRILGSTNEYVKVEKEEEKNTEENQNTIPNQGGNYASNSTTNNNNSSTTIINGGSGTTGNVGNNSNITPGTKMDTTWVDDLNKWIKDVAAGFDSIYNGNSGKKDDATLAKSIKLNSLSSGVTYIDVNYSVTDPESKYNVVYLRISGDNITPYNISLDKSNTSYRVTGLSPNTNYYIEMGYKTIFADASVEEMIEDTMVTRTKSPVESLKITRVSTDKVYYSLKLDSEFVYDSGAEIAVYVNNQETADNIITLTSSELEQAGVNGYTGSFAIPNEYKTSNGAIKIELQNLKYNGQEINKYLSSKIINY